MSVTAALDALSALLGDRLSRAKADLDAHGRSESHFPTTPPDAVAYPESTDEVAALVRICAAARCPVIGWGAGTSLEGHALAVRGGVAVDFSRMAALLEVAPEDMVARVQPGMTREALNTELRATGLFFPVDPGANASLGGMASTRASGTTAVRYGTMRDNVAALEVVTASGEVIRTGTRARKSSAGYDLTGLFVGAEGTLGLITELTLRLQGQPEAISAAVCAFADIGAAVDAVVETMQSGVPMARIEFLDAASVAAVNAHAKADFPRTPHLFVEFHGSEAGVAEQAARFAEIAAEHGARGLERAHRPEERNRLWQMRHHAYWAILASRPGARAIVTDVCVPLSRLAEAVAATQADIDAAGLAAPILGHVGDGNFHAILLLDGSDAERRAAERVSRAMVERALEIGGTATGEHGIGIGKLGYMEAEHGAAGWGMMGALKAALDPHDIMNPGKLVPPRQAGRPNPR
ncbi:putative D-lactate dehydrogenase (cytochrome), FAD/FMN-containing oxidoreductase [Oceanicola granulosus HTCC2516]|uniref:D-lactate dehydrogenase (cytochrome) n=1 Tax=Oceanicola granulosus (strain ATCC BAA-861 / DSM 15982 / KCTC 12143 / HTCC2516) TaxID=314256 RepID=Q2CIX0_OCEGH|nr:FAD-linked oxidase C-terminal domain-containing protein [Oceanicola granulosus]EAR52469.1 putative D-lactate dehydrogenase (cytochrome), FAD/FMN-containing oxidoreductase [Oceanicola granulosus HTCC2516]